MTSYARAWNLIEKAKAYHKMEDHIQAKENYEKACEILKELPSYNYEAAYYSAWASQEEAEQLSKQERHEEAIEIRNGQKKLRQRHKNAGKRLQPVYREKGKRKNRETRDTSQGKDELLLSQS